MYRFVVQVHSIHKGLFYWLHWFSYVSNMLLAPIISVVTYAVVGRFAGGPDEAMTFAIGVIMSQMSLVAIGGVTQTYAYDRNLGTVAFLYISPANRFVNFCTGD
jgi:hypothetical protein